APMAPAPLPLTHDVTIVTTRKLAQARVMGVPPEEFGIERGARSIRDCNYCFHEVVTRTAAQLIAQGFDEEQIQSLNDYTGTTEIETLARDTGGEQCEILCKGGKECITAFDAMPFAATTPVPITHRFFGRSIADLVMPLQ